jgi:hypothetical protein
MAATSPVDIDAFFEDAFSTQDGALCDASVCAGQKEDRSDSSSSSGNTHEQAGISQPLDTRNIRYHRFPKGGGGLTELAFPMEVLTRIFAFVASNVKISRRILEAQTCVIRENTKTAFLKILPDLSLSASVEAALYDINTGRITKAYRTKARALLFNIKNNEELKKSLQERRIDATELVTMSSDELASKSLNELRKST